jgi:hypothetical protein
MMVAGDHGATDPLDEGVPADTIVLTEVHASAEVHSISQGSDGSCCT